MSAPVRGAENDDYGPLNYAPKRARRLEDQNPGNMPGKPEVPPPRRTPRPPEPLWEQTARSATVGGDVGFAGANGQRSLRVDRIPEPRPRRSTARIVSVKSITGVGVVAALGAAAYFWVSAPTAVLPSRPFSLASADSVRKQATGNLGASSFEANPPVARSAASAVAPVSTVKLERGIANAAVPADAAQVAVPAPEPRIVETSPASPAGKSVTAPPKPESRRLEASEIALMVKRGAALMANGSIGAARMLFQAAADADDPAAAFALAETYDPLVLKTLGAQGGITPNVALAHAWYEKAMALGSTGAPARLDRLARLPQ
jgi:hypothetical protein